jgi:hypothetical protein
MTPWHAWLPLSLTLLSVGAQAAEVGAVTLLEGGGRLLRGATWYKLVTGARVEESDILEVADKTQAQIEFKAGSIVNLYGAGTVYLPPPPAKAKPGPVTLVVPAGWIKAVAKPSGLQLRTPLLEFTGTDAIVVMRVSKAVVDFFVESGDGHVVEVASSGADGPPRDAKRGEYVAKAPSGAITTVERAPRVFVDEMPRAYIDPLPVLAARLKAPPVLVVDREITYAEAEPWLSGRDRALFERRFTSRLRDPAFRSAVMPNAARYPTWDRILNPQKYEPKKDEARKATVK